ncbi:MAG: type II toxin-antitoxin system YafQ family toxin [Prevotellaceae bacterium]|nr:type II toxin-antitoxin system YafQ family toxin [Prevotellaceae bacterium]
MAYTIKSTHRFDKDLRKCIARGFPIEEFKQVVSILSETGKLPEKYKSHKLKGKYAGMWECHIKPDWLLVWDQDDTNLVLLLLDTGTHSDLF